MYITYCSSEEYSEYTGISLYSLLKNNDINDIDGVFLYSNNISERSKQIIINICSCYEVELKIIEVKDLMQSIIEKYSLPDFGGGITVYIQSFPDLVFPEYVKKVLLIDSDTIVNGSLKEMNKLDISNKAMAVVKNPEFIDNESLSEEEKDIVEKNGYYFNAGVILFNLDFWKDNKCTQLCLDSCTYLKKIVFASQTILNYSIPESYIYFMHPKYNYFGHCYPQYINNYFDKYKSYYGNEIALEAINNPLIIHYKGIHSRPWFKESTSVLKDVYSSYKSKTAWKKQPYLSFYKSTVYNKSNVITKLKYRLIIPIYQKKIYKLVYEIFRKER